MLRFCIARRKSFVASFFQRRRVLTKVLHQRLVLDIATTHIVLPLQRQKEVPHGRNSCYANYRLQFCHADLELQLVHILQETKLALDLSVFCAVTVISYSLRERFISAGLHFPFILLFACYAHAYGHAICLALSPVHAVPALFGLISLSAHTRNASSRYLQEPSCHQP